MKYSVGEELYYVIRKPIQNNIMSYHKIGQICIVQAIHPDEKEYRVSFDYGPDFVIPEYNLLREDEEEYHILKQYKVGDRVKFILRDFSKPHALHEEIGTTGRILSISELGSLCSFSRTYVKSKNWFSPQRKETFTVHFSNLEGKDFDFNRATGRTTKMLNDLVTELVDRFKKGKKHLFFVICANGQQRKDLQNKLLRLINKELSLHNGFEVNDNSIDVDKYISVVFLAAGISGKAGKYFDCGVSVYTDHYAMEVLPEESCDLKNQIFAASRPKMPKEKMYYFRIFLRDGMTVFIKNVKDYNLSSDDGFYYFVSVREGVDTNQAFAIDTIARYEHWQA